MREDIFLRLRCELTKAVFRDDDDRRFLCAYRWDGEAGLAAEKFVIAPIGRAEPPASWFSGWDLEGVNAFFVDGSSHAEYRTEMFSRWEECYPPETRDEFPFEELSPGVFERLRSEWQQQIAAGPEIHHADLPFRPLMSWALRQVPERAARRFELERFFRNFCENAAQ
jgi:hypothetical protein